MEPIFAGAGQTWVGQKRIVKSEWEDIGQEGRYWIGGKVLDRREGIGQEGRYWIGGKVEDRREGGMGKYMIRGKVGWKGIRLERRWDGKV